MDIFRSFLYVVFIGALFTLIGVPFVYAAPLTWSSDTNVALTSPATNFTITAGSVADAFQANATSVVVTISASTGGAFTLTSASYDLIISSSTGGGSAPTSCTSGVASTTITQSSGSAVYTISPAADQCGSSGGGGGGGSGAGQSVGVGAGPNFDEPTSTPTSATSGTVGVAGGPSSSTAPGTSTLEAEITSLEAELQSLLSEVPSASSPGSSLPPELTLYNFTRNLAEWDTGLDVNALQKLLVQLNTGPAARVLKANGVTKTFGPLTDSALKEFQRYVGLPSTGYFGRLTRAYLLKHY